MKITGFKTRLVEIPFERPIATAIHQMRSVGCVLLELETDQGLVGESRRQHIATSASGAAMEVSA